MRYSLKNRFFLLKKDVLYTFREHRSEGICGVIVLLVGVALGIYIGAEVGEKESPFSVFAAMFGLEFAPFSYLIPDFLRFFLFGVVASLGFILPFTMLYSALSLFFFGKYFGEIACVAFLSDSALSGVLSVLIVYLPLLFAGGAMILCIAVKAKRSRLLRCTDPCRRSLKRDILFVTTLFLIYFAILFIVYVVICGTVYLIMIAL